MLWLSCGGQIDVWELFSDNSYLSAIVDRQGLMVAAPVDIRTKKAEGFCLGTPLENPFKTNWREGLSCTPIQFLQDRI